MNSPTNKLILDAQRVLNYLPQDLHKRVALIVTEDEVQPLISSPWSMRPALSDSTPYAARDKILGIKMMGLTLVKSEEIPK